MPQSDLVAALAALPGVPGDLLAVLAAAAAESGMVHCALVGGSVADSPEERIWNNTRFSPAGCSLPVWRRAWLHL